MTSKMDDELKKDIKYLDLDATQVTAETKMEK